MISTRGRYALRVMIDLAEHRNGRYIPMKDVAERQDISADYKTKTIKHVVYRMLTFLLSYLAFSRYL